MKTDRNMEDMALLSSLRKGEQQAFDSLFRKYYPMLCAHARQLANTGYGEKNAEFARQNMNTELIAQKTILCYQQIYNLTLHENPTDR